MRVAVAGSSGMLGTDLVQLIKESRDHEMAGAYDIKEGVDLLDADALRVILRKNRPDVLINCAAYTDVDGAEKHRTEALRANRDIPEALANVACFIGVRIIHISTDYVFDGKKSTPYTEKDKPAPQSVYAQSKLEGEERLMASGCDSIIVRSSWLYGRNGKNFVDRVRELAAGGGPLRIVDDQRGCPTWTAELAKALMALANLDIQGIVNFGSAGNCTWCEFAQEIIRQAGLDAEVIPITTAELGRPAHRPAYSVLDTSHYEKLTGLAPLPWQEALRQYLSTPAQGG
ncbi:dTDP-4-dehydrorhamnose reductase [Acidobacteriota bacterium]